MHALCSCTPCTHLPPHISPVKKKMAASLNGTPFDLCVGYIYTQTSWREAIEIQLNLVSSFLSHTVQKEARKEPDPTGIQTVLGLPLYVVAIRGSTTIHMNWVNKLLSSNFTCTDGSQPRAHNDIILIALQWRWCHHAVVLCFSVVAVQWVEYPKYAVFHI